MKILRGMIVAVCLGIIAFSAWKLYSIRSGYRQGEQTYEALEVYVSVPAPAAQKPDRNTQKPSQSESEAPTEETEPAEVIDFPVVDFDALREINSSVMGWLYCEGTNINYPVVQGPDNEYYLNHLFDKTPNGTGAIYLSSDNKPGLTDRNNIIFGHNMKNGSMFAGLFGFKDQSFALEHPRFLLVTPNANYTMDVFAGVVMGEWDNVWQTIFADDEEMEVWLQNIQSRSRIVTDVVPTAKDTILTLSTCSYEYENARFVVLGVLKER